MRHQLTGGFLSLLLALSGLLSLPSGRVWTCEDPVCVTETTNLLKLLPDGTATHRAVASGDWSATTTWLSGLVPTAGARVLIPKGVDVRYDLLSDTRLDTVRVDGSLVFATDRSTKIVLDTLVVPERNAVLRVGSPTDPILLPHTATILITGDRRDNGTTVLAAADRKQFGRGVVSKGQVTMCGARKDPFLELVGDAKIGDSTLTFKQSPVGWQVGDILVVAATYHKPAFFISIEPDPNFFQRAAANEEYDVEELTITQIDGNVVRFTNNALTSGNRNVLRYDHILPKGQVTPANVSGQIALHVGNLSRNITIRSESGFGPDFYDSGYNPTTKTTDFTKRHNEIMKRGHVMFMHNENVDIVNVAFWDLGRTDKHRDLDEVDFNLDGTPGTGTNQRGRYAVHFHRTGSTGDRAWMGKPSHIQGCAVKGSPGWGIAHHEAYLTVEDNFIYDILGTAVMQESGNEIGTWRHNLAMKIYGGAGKITANTPVTGGSDYTVTSRRILNFDYGWEGVGFWLHGSAQIAGEDNIANSCANAAFAAFGNGDGGAHNRGAENMAVSLLPSAWSDIARGFADPTYVEVTAVPTRQLKRLVGYNSGSMVHIWGHMLRAGTGFSAPGGTQIPFHDHRALVEDILGWDLQGYGLRIEYSSSYNFRDGLLIHADSEGFRFAGNKMHGTMVNFENITFDGYGSAFGTPGTDGGGSEVKNCIVRARQAPLFWTFGGDYPANYRIIDCDFSVTANKDFPQIASNKPPTPSFTASTLGGTAQFMDATASFDEDGRLEENGRFATSKGIVSAGWDFNNDGKIDEFGRSLKHYFPAAGSYPVTLTVWDNLGVKRSVTNVVTVASTPYPNAFSNGDFSLSVLSDDGQPYTSSGQTGVWYNHNRNAPPTNGTILINNGWAGGLGQIVHDESMRRGPQTFKVDLKGYGTVEPGSKNTIVVKIFGFKGGQWRGDLFQPFDPSPDGGQPFLMTKLLEKNVTGTLPWTTFTWPVDLGDGYEWLLLQINPDHCANVEVDNVSLLSTATTPTPLLKPAVNLAPDITLDVSARISPNFELAADVRDPDGSIAKVEFFDGTTKLGERTSQPFVYAVTNAAAGMHQFMARATDNQGAKTDSFERYSEVIVPKNKDAPDTTKPDKPSKPSYSAGLISGYAEIGAKVTVFIDGKQQAIVTASSVTGYWSWKVPSSVAPGVYFITVTATDAANNVSDPSDQTAMTIPPGGVDNPGTTTSTGSTTAGTNGTNGASGDGGGGGGGGCGLGAGLALMGCGLMAGRRRFRTDRD